MDGSYLSGEEEMDEAKLMVGTSGAEVCLDCEGVMDKSE